MSDDKTKRDERDRARVAGGEDYEVAYFAREYGLSADEVRGLIERVGNDRDVLKAEAEKMAKAAR